MRRIAALQSTSLASFFKRYEGYREAGLRRDGKYVQIVLPLINAGKHPRKEDIAAALRQVTGDLGYSDIAELLNYVTASYVLGRSRDPGRKTRRSYLQDKKIAVEYFTELERARAAREANSRLPADVATRTKRKVAQKYKISKSTLETIIKELRPRFS